MLYARPFSSSSASEAATHPLAGGAESDLFFDQLFNADYCFGTGLSAAASTVSSSVWSFSNTYERLQRVNPPEPLDHPSLARQLARFLHPDNAEYALALAARRRYC